MGRPTGCARNRENRGEEVRWDSEAVVDGGRVEIDVCVEAFAFAHHGGDAFAHPNPFWFTELFGEFDGHALEMRRARVEHFVDAVTDAHDFLFLSQLLLEPRIHVFFGANLLEHVDDALIRATVERTLEGADGGGDCGEHVAQRCHGDTGAERTGVHAMIGMEDVSDVKGLSCLCGGFCSVDEVQKMSGFREVLTHGREVFALTETVEIRRNHADFRGDIDGAVVVRFWAGFLVVEAEEGHSGADDVHRRCVFGRGFEEIDDALWEGALCAQFRGECVQL